MYNVEFQMKNFIDFRRTPQMNVSWLKDDDFFFFVVLHEWFKILRIKELTLTFNFNFFFSLYVDKLLPANAKEQFHLISRKYKFSNRFYYYVDVIT